MSGQEVVSEKFQATAKHYSLRNSGVKYSVLRCLSQCNFLFLFYLPLLTSKLPHRGALCAWYFDKVEGKRPYSVLGMMWDKDK